MCRTGEGWFSRFSQDTSFSLHAITLTIDKEEEGSGFIGNSPSHKRFPSARWTIKENPSWRLRGKKRGNKGVIYARQLVHPTV